MSSERGEASPEPLEVAAIVVGGPGVALDRPVSTDGSSYRDPVGAYLASLSTEKSRATARESMRRVARILGVQKDPRDHDAWRRIPWVALTYAETNMVRAALVATTKPATTRLTLAVMKRVLRECFRLQLIGAEQYQRAVDLERVRGQSARPGRELTQEDVERLEKHFSGREEPFQSMLRALFAVGIGAGLRREELARLLLEGVQGDELRFIGKGLKEAVQRIEPWALGVLQAWLRVRAEAGFKAPTVFVRYDDKGEVLVDEPMQPRDVWKLVTSEARAAGIRKITTHDLRRTFGTRVIREKDAILAKQALRHVNMATTERYDRRGDDALKEALATMQPMMEVPDGSTGRPQVHAPADGSVPLRAGKHGPDRSRSGHEHGKDGRAMAGEHWRAFEVFFRAHVRGDPRLAGPRVVAAFLERAGDPRAAADAIWPVLSGARRWTAEECVLVKAALR